MNLSWGRPRIFVKEEGSDTWNEKPTPVENTTELQPTEGEKIEAKIEGGQNEDVRTKDTTYALAYNIRKSKSRTEPFKSKNGIVSKHYSILLMPEDPECLGFYIEKSSVSIMDTFTPTDGAIWGIKHAVIAATTGNSVKWGTVTISNSGGQKISFTETQPADGCEATNITSETVVELSA